MYFATLSLLVFLILFLILATFALIHQCYYSLNPKRMVFYPTFLTRNVKQKLVQIIEKYAGKTEGKDLVELGCGMGQTVHFLGQKFVWKKVLGIEVDNLTFLGARFYNHFQKTKINLDKADILDCKINEKSVIYCYLGPDLMSLLYNSGQFENCLVISLTFRIHECDETEKIASKSSYGQIYVYDFLPKVEENSQNS